MGHLNAIILTEGVGSKTSQSSKVQMPGESLREGECLGFEVTDALPAAQKIAAISTTDQVYIGLILI